MKRLLSIVLGLALIGGFVGYKMWTKPHENMQKASADLQVKATELFAAFETDETAANSNYLDKVVQVQGTVKEVTKDGDVVKVMLDAGEEALGGVYCELDPLSDHERTDFPEGESIKLKCNCTGFTMVDVQMTRCVEAK